VALVGLGLWWTGIGLDWGTASAETTIQTAYNERASLTLPGGTDIVLNANSRLRILMDGDGEPKREVYLDGEAFFNVGRVGEGKDRRPFIVRTDDGTIRVLGTRFTVARRARQTRVTLNEGEVAVQAEYLASSRQPAAPETATGRGQAVTLRPGQLAAFGPDREAIHVQEVNPQVYSSWTTGTLIFDETPIAVIAERIEHTYGLKVRAEDQDVFRETVSGQVENDLDVFISGLSRLLGRPVQRTGDAVIIQ
jgi:ferric-dicitrate binding protein FerR (iron transport regulator)